jgi:hypothetical protein
VKPPTTLEGSSPSELPPPSSRLMRTLGPAVARDTDATPFSAILAELLQRVPGSYAAALVDAEGETVDYAGYGDPFDLRVAAAHLQLVLQGIRNSAHGSEDGDSESAADVERTGVLGEPRWVVVRGHRKSVAASVLPDGYALALLLRPRSAFAISTRALKVCTRALAAEAGWTDLELRDGVKQRSWFAVEVETDGRGRPVRIGANRVVVEVLGAVMGLAVRERGFRVRTLEGTELTLVREPRQLWYADEPV